MYHTFGEFKVKLDDLLMQVERLCDEQTSNAPLANAKRSLGLIGQKLGRKELLGPLERQQMANALEAVRSGFRGDPRWVDQMYDIEDYVDANCLAKKPAS